MGKRIREKKGRRGQEGRKIGRGGGGGGGGGEEDWNETTLHFLREKIETNEGSRYF